MDEFSLENYKKYVFKTDNLLLQNLNGFVGKI